MEEKFTMNNMNIPLVDLKSNYLSIKDEIDTAIQNVIDKTSFIMGEPLKKFEQNFADFCRCKMAIGCSSGTTAVHLALLAAGLKKGDEVITVPNTFIATTECITYVGGKIQFADVKADTRLINIDELEKIKDAVLEIQPQRIHLNTVIRPPAENTAKELSLKELKRIKTIFGDKCSVIGEFKKKGQELDEIDVKSSIMSLIKRRSVTLSDISNALGINKDLAMECLKDLQKENALKRFIYDGQDYYGQIDVLDRKNQNVPQEGRKEIKK